MLGRGELDQEDIRGSGKREVEKEKRGVEEGSGVVEKRGIEEKRR